MNILKYILLPLPLLFGLCVAPTSGAQGSAAERASAVTSASVTAVRAEGPQGEISAAEFRQMPARYPAGDTLVVRVVGDVMLHQAQIDAAGRPDGSWNFSGFLDSLEADFSTADLALANMEFSLGGEPYSGYPSFSAPDAYPAYCREQGINVFLLANNHLCDKGRKGLRRTVERYQALECPFTGAAEGEDIAPLLLECKGVRIGIVNYTDLSNVRLRPGAPRLYDSLPDALRCVREARAKGCALVLVFPHWGEEYMLQYNVRQDSLARLFIRAGADAVIGAHPHVVQPQRVLTDIGPEGERRSVPVFFSLGNAISNMSAENTQVEQMLTLSIPVRNPADFSWQSLWLWCSRPGGVCGTFSVRKIGREQGARAQWRGPWEHDKMTSAFRRVSRSCPPLELR